jgi:hypothetical protein
MASKIMLSDDELLFLQQTQPFALKAAVTEKVYEFLAIAKAGIAGINEQNTFIFPKGTDTVSGKISKGENYKGLPYFVLDFPKLFNTENIFAFRVMLWWGNYWSVHLHLSGTSWQLYRTAVYQNIGKIAGENFYLNTSDEEWNYEMNESNFLPINEANIEAIKDRIQSLGYLRLSAKTAISPQLPDKWIFEHYTQLMQLVLTH